MIHLGARGAVAVLRFDHGAVSAVDIELMMALSERLAEVEESGYDSAVLTGTGSSFSAGVDLWRVLEGGELYLREFLPALTGVVSRLFTFPKPVVAAVNGHAIAGGCILACCCDYRIMADGEGKMGVPELRVGVPFPSLALEILRFSVSSPRVQELVYLGHTYAPTAARELGLVDELAAPEDLLERACQVAENMAAIPVQSFKIAKRQLRQPVLDRAAAVGKDVEDAVAKVWSDPEIHAVIRSYMDATVHRRSEP